MSDIPEQSLSTLFASKSDRNCIHWSSLRLPEGFCLAIKEIVRQLEMVIVKKNEPETSSVTKPVSTQ